MTHDPRPGPPGLLARLKQLGPGLVTGASNDDPAAIGTFSQVGAQFGLAPLWLNVYTLPLMGAVLEMNAQIGNVSGQGLATTLRYHYPRWVLFGALALLVGTNLLNLAADLAIMAEAVTLVAPLRSEVWLVAIGAGSALAQAYLPYARYARVLKLLTLTLLAYVVTAVLVTRDWGSVLRATVVPTVYGGPAFLQAVVAVIGTRLSPYVLLWQPSQIVEEKVDAGETRLHERRDISKGDVRRVQADVAAGSLVANLVTWSITATAAATLHAAGITNVATATQAAQALRPLAGPAASIVFAVGILATGLLAVPVLSAGLAYGLGEAFGWERGLRRGPARQKRFYGVMAAALAVAVALNFLGMSPVRALFVSQLVNGIAGIPLVYLVLRICNDRAIMGERTNGRLANTLGWAALLVMVAAGAGAGWALAG